METDVSDDRASITLRRRRDGAAYFIDITVSDGRPVQSVGPFGTQKLADDTIEQMSAIGVRSGGKSRKA